MARGHRRSATVPATGGTFEDVVLPHLDAGYRLACWLLRSEGDAEDVVQESALRALRYFRTFVGGNGRAWFLRIVRHTCWSSRSGVAPGPTDPFDEQRHGVERSVSDPEALLIQIDTAALIDRALRELPDRFRELFVLRELEGLSYRELARVFDIPMGTVMSGLYRARRALRMALAEPRQSAAGGIFEGY
jgi:RNA polymerase sigma-70 factor (ECF subfamily)